MQQDFSGSGHSDAYSENKRSSLLLHLNGTRNGGHLLLVGFLKIYNHSLLQIYVRFGATSSVYSCNEKCTSKWRKLYDTSTNNIINASFTAHRKRQSNVEVKVICIFIYVHTCREAKGNDKWPILSCHFQLCRILSCLRVHGTHLS